MTLQVRELQLLRPCHGDITEDIREISLHVIPQNGSDAIVPVCQYSCTFSKEALSAAEPVSRF